MATCKKYINGFYHNVSTGILVKRHLVVILFYSSFSSILRHFSLRPRTKNVKAPPTILTNKHTSEAEGSFDTFPPSRPRKVDCARQDWGRTGGGHHCQVMIEEINLYESPKFIQPFSNPEKFEIKAKLTEKNERKSIINNLLAAF